MYQYYLKIVPTRYRKINGQSINTNQYSVSTHKKAVTQNLGDTGLPGVFFMFEISPILVQMKESRRWVQPAAQDHRRSHSASLCTVGLCFALIIVYASPVLQTQWPCQPQTACCQTTQILHTLSYRRLRNHRGDLYW